MKKKLFLKFFVLAVIGAFVTFTSCKDYDDDINKLNTELNALKADAVKKSDLTALQTLLEGKITALQTEVTTLKNSLSQYATKAELDAAMATVVKLETYNAWKAIVDADLAKLKADVAKAATKEELEAVNTTLTAAQNQMNAKIANIEAILQIADGKSAVIEGLKEQLAEQLALIQANRADIEDLKTDFAQLDTKLENLKNRVDGIEALLLNVYADLDNRVYSLTFIPDFTSTDGTVQIVVNGLSQWGYFNPASNSHSTIWTVPGWNANWDENWAVLRNGTIYKGVAILRYNVSPSNVKLTDFEVKQMVNKASVVRAAGSTSAPIVLAGEATLANGILSVPVVVEANTYNSANIVAGTNNTTQNYSVALQVENINVALDNNKERIITSTEYVKANFDLSHGRIALNGNSLKPDGTRLPVGIQHTNIASASYATDINLWNGKSQSGNMTDVLNHTIDLKDYVYGVFDDFYGNWKKMTENGFNKHVFKFRRVYLQSEGVNQTNDYVNLTEDGIIGVVAANGNVNQAAVGRTPIVEVTAVVDGKVHAVGYIKIRVTDQFDNSDINFEFTLEDYVLGCNSSYALTDVDIDEIDFDQIFNHGRIQLGKDAFFAEYNQNPMVVTAITPPTPAAATVGYNDPSKHVSFAYAINPATQSVNLYNYIEGDIRNDAPAGTYKVTTRLKSNGFRPDVVITWNFKVVLPTNLSLTRNEVFLYNNIYKVEPTVYGQTPTPKSSTPYEGLLQNAYLHTNLSLDLSGVAGDQNCAGYLTPYFIFTKAPQGFHINTVGTAYGQAYEIRQNGTNALAASIFKWNSFNAPSTNPLSFFATDGWYIVLNNQDWAGAGSQVGNFKPLSAAAVALVESGESVEVQARGYINGQQLNHVKLDEPFKITFTKPLKFNFANKYNLWDQGVGAKQQVEIVTIPTGFGPTFEPNIVVKDFLNNDIRFGTAAQGRTTPLINHYEIAYTSTGGFLPSWAPNLVFDVTNVTTSLPGGQLPNGMSLKVDPSSTHGHHIYKWENATGGSVQNAFEIYVPVTLVHKWGVLEQDITIVVNPGTGN